MKTAILFLIFNRPDTTRQVFEVIRHARPPRLFISADGPRSKKPGEKELCDNARRVAAEVDWHCDVKTLFREDNLGCRLAVSSGISWFFEHEEDGIIIEDDVLPSPDFFSYCEKMLEEYRYDNRIMMITGTNYHPTDNCSGDYFFSQHFSIWGWATWRRAWRLYDINITGWPSSSNISFLNYHFGTKIAKHFIHIFNLITDRLIDTWDIQWVYCCIFNNGLCITPRVNLISNIGVTGTHSNVITDNHMLQYGRLNSDSLKRPDNVCVEVEYDLYLHKTKFIPAARIEMMANILRSIGLYGLVRSFYKTASAAYYKLSKFSSTLDSKVE
jgi:hypothetical protein